MTRKKMSPINWIPCSTSLPEMDVDVLTVNERGELEILKFDSCKHNRNPRPRWAQIGRRLPTGRITHWMSLDGLRSLLPLLLEPGSHEE